MSDEILTHQLKVLHDDVVDLKSSLDKVADAVVRLALVEERQAQASNALQRAFEAIERVERRLTEVERATPLTERTNVWMDRLVWGCVAAVGVFIAERILK
jgi:uncharacterized protein YoxC